MIPKPYLWKMSLWQAFRDETLPCSLMKFKHKELQSWGPVESNTDLSCTKLSHAQRSTCFGRQS
ncbi:hypothetical protein MUK42_18146 [Musa troglodytarum]|uniref:Uncharacterized protein n=1 Tax=Musa troglodytarum TaxID=320322 RepID=A0A9E7GNG1_9LILI|nr:hypothetical protein MUK42_18146 [Musa troglodytarum]